MRLDPHCSPGSRPPRLSNVRWRTMRKATASYASQGGSSLQRSPLPDCRRARSSLGVADSMNGMARQLDEQAARRSSLQEQRAARGAGSSLTEAVVATSPEGNESRHDDEPRGRATCFQVAPGEGGVGRAPHPGPRARGRAPESLLGSRSLERTPAGWRSEIDLLIGRPRVGTSRLLVRGSLAAGHGQGRRVGASSSPSPT